MADRCNNSGVGGRHVRSGVAVMERTHVAGGSWHLVAGQSWQV